MFEKFNDKSIKAVMLAQEEARKLGHGFVGTEQLLLGLIGEATNIAAKALKNFGLNLTTLRSEINSTTTPNQRTIGLEIPFTPRCKTVFRLAVTQRDKLRADQVGPEHILLGIIEEGNGHACTILEKFTGVGFLSSLRNEVLRLLNEPATSSSSAATSVPPETATRPKTPRRASSSTPTTATPTLEEYGTNLTKRAADGQLDPMIGREEELERMIQTLIRRRKNNPLLIGEPGTGKAQSLDSLVLTPHGWVTMGSLKVGDQIITPKGGVTNITGVFPQGLKNMYKVTFADGRSTESCNEHLWKVWLPKGKGNPRVWSVENLEYIQKRKLNKNIKLYVPLIENVWNETIDLPMNPYVLGVLLGDGGISQATIKLTSADDSIVELCNQQLTPGYAFTPEGFLGMNYALTGSRALKEKPKYINILKQLNLMGHKSNTKFIPAIYKNASCEQRLQLIRGLMDTDGTVGKTGNVSFTSTSYQLALDLQYLIRSIGGIATIRPRQRNQVKNGIRKPGLPSYDVSIRYHHPRQLFTLERKLKRLSEHYQYEDLKLEIKSIEYVGKKEAQCIMIDDPDHLYITDDFIVTHNTAITEGLAQRIVDGLVPPELQDKQVYLLDLARMVAGTKYRGEFEERLKRILKEIKDAQVILVIDEIHTLIGAGAAEGSMDAANMLKPALARGEIQCIGATTLKEYRKHIARDAALERRFQPIMLDEPSVEQTIEILWGLRTKYESYHQLLISDKALVAAVMFSDRYIADRHQPDKAIDLIDEAASKLKLQTHKQQKARADIDAADVVYTSPVVTEEHIADVVSQWSNIPVTQLTESETQRLIHLEDKLHEYVIGQHDAIAVLSKTLRRARMGLKNPNKPTGTFLFTGPTGVGKSLAAKTLAELYFGSENALVRVDCSELMESHSVSKLIGSPPGYVGYNDHNGGQLTNMVRSRPYSVVLFDEIEKAHPDVFNLLLQLLDDGHLTDSTGRKVSFKNTIVIMTSNIGGEVLGKGQFGIGFGASGTTHKEAAAKYIDSQLKTRFRPEFLNRLDNIIAFHQLTRTEVIQIVDLMLKELTERVKESYTITFTQQLKDKIVKDGYSEQYGARPLRREIQRLIEDHLADDILSSRINVGDHIVIDVVGEDVVITHQQEQVNVESNT